MWAGVGLSLRHLLLLLLMTAVLCGGRCAEEEGVDDVDAALEVVNTLIQKAAGSDDPDHELVCATCRPLQLLGFSSVCVEEV